jgi:hypothetical protein
MRTISNSYNISLNVNSDGKLEEEFLKEFNELMKKYDWHLLDVSKSGFLNEKDKNK